MTDHHERPTVNQPLNAPRRKLATPALIVLGLLALGALVMIVIGILRYTT